MAMLPAHEASSLALLSASEAPTPIPRTTLSAFSLGPRRLPGTSRAGRRGKNSLPVSWAPQLGSWRQHSRSPALVVVASSATGSSSEVQEASSAAAEASPVLKVIISGAPASGKGTQCELIVQKFGLVHISAGDLLRAEVREGTPNGAVAKSYMDKGLLVPDSVVNTIVTDKLKSAEEQGQGWLLDGYPRSQTQADALIAKGIVPDVFILLNVPDSVIIQRVAGRRSDPVTGKIYHLLFAPPPDDPVIRARLVQRSDDTEEAAIARLATHARNVQSVLSLYKDKIVEVDGNRPKAEVFGDVEQILNRTLEAKGAELRPGASSAHTANGAPAATLSREVEEEGGAWVGMPTRLNDIPHTREIRKYFYADACSAVERAVRGGLRRMQVNLLIPELNPEMDVYRIGTLLELMRELAFTFAKQGKRVKVCVQGAMGTGIFTGMPLALAGTRRLLDAMDWGQEEDSDSEEAGLAQRITTGAIGAREVGEEDEVFLLMAPQNAVGNCILEDLEAMAEAAGSRPIILINPRLKDIPSAAGVMQVQGRAERLQFKETFVPCYTLRLLFNAGSFFPILGAVRLAYPGQYEVYKRVDVAPGQEKYDLCDSFPVNPTSAELTAAFAGKKRAERASATQEQGQQGVWGFLSNLFS